MENQTTERLRPAANGDERTGIRLDATSASRKSYMASPMSGVILVIEDEKDLVGALEYNLEREGYQTRSSLTGRGGLMDAISVLAGSHGVLGSRTTTGFGLNVAYELKDLRSSGVTTTRPRKSSLAKPNR